VKTGHGSEQSALIVDHGYEQVLVLQDLQDAVCWIINEIR